MDPSQLPKDKPKSKKRAAGMAIFEDERLGYAFAVPPNFKGQSSSVGNGGQIIAFFDSETGDINTRITLVAQPAPVDSLDELKKSFVPNGEISKQGMEMKSVGKEDGAVYVVETAQKDKPTMITLFALRKQPAPVGNWLISLTTQASPEVFGKYEKEFRAIFKSFRLIYPDTDARDVGEEELGKKVGEIELSDEVNAVPFGGR